MKLVVLLVVASCGYPALSELRQEAVDALPADAELAPPPADASNTVTIQQVQSDTMPIGTPVTLVDVVVTAVDHYGARTGDCWVEERGGGPLSGIHIFNPAPTGFKPGDVVTVAGGVKAEFDINGAHLRTETELLAPAGGIVIITTTGTAALPAPALVDALAIDQLPEPAQSQAWEQWEGVRIKITNVRERAAPGVVGGDPTQLNFLVTGNIAVQSSLVAFPSRLAADVCLASATGVVSTIINFLLLPTETNDVAIGGLLCP